MCLTCLAGLCLVVIRVHVPDIPRATLNFTTSRVLSSLGRWNQFEAPAITVASMFTKVPTDPVSSGSNVSGLNIGLPPGPTQQVQFTAAIKQRLNSSQGVILLAMVDAPFVKMAINFYKTSLQPFRIENYLFVGVSDRACALLSDEGLPCFKYTEDTASDKASVYMSKDFIRKMNIRTDMILEALQAGYTVLHTDTDMVFLQNPMPLLNEVPPEVDVAPLWDESAYNAGFLLVRPTANGIWIYKRSRDLTKQNSKLDDQKALNRAIKENARYNKGAVKKLDGRYFLNGRAYFEKTRRMFAGDSPCGECVVVHNNWIVSEEAKIYRFKEHHMWAVDGPNLYHTDPSRKYLIYDNPSLLGRGYDIVKNDEKDSLINSLAIGIILNRTVILAPFHCGKNMDLLCPLNERFSLSAFDSEFGGSYRETTFLSHPLVPKSVRGSASPVFLIETDLAKSRVHVGNLSVPTFVQRLRPSSPSRGATSSEISRWFGGEQASVLQFHSLYDSFSGFDNHEDQDIFAKTVRDALRVSSYRQYKRG